MITPEEAYKIATREPGFPLAPIAYDYFDKWVFTYGGDREIIGFWPVTINKADGRLDYLELGDCFEFLNKIKKLKSFPISNMH